MAVIYSIIAPQLPPQPSISLPQTGGAGFKKLDRLHLEDAVRVAAAEVRVVGGERGDPRKRGFIFSGVIQDERPRESTRGLLEAVRVWDFLAVPIQAIVEAESLFVYIAEEVIWFGADVSAAKTALQR